MIQLLALLLLTAAEAPPVHARTALPGRAEAATAYSEWEADACRALIDACEGGVGVRAPEDVSGLRCGTGRRGNATCRFRVAGNRCRAEFVSAAAGPAHARALQWSQLPPRPADSWAVAWTVSPAPRGPRIRCTAAN